MITITKKKYKSRGVENGRKKQNKNGYYTQEFLER